MKKGIKSFISGGAFRKIAIAGAALMIIALMSSMGLAGPIYVDITYYPNTPDTQAPVKDSFLLGTTTLIKDNPSFINPGFKFIGWNTRADGAGRPYMMDDDVTMGSHLTLYAQWLANSAATVTMTYKANAGDSQSDIKENVLKNSNYAVRPNYFTRNGYTFTGWNTNANGSGQSFSPGQIVTASANYTVYAQWQVSQVEKVTITYKANAGDAQADIKDNPSKGSSYTVRANPFTRSGYTFTGWNTNANGSGQSFNPGQAVTASANVTVYAQWIVTPG
jgi:uncharacterized repeat protein (TIGR02543 family)